MYFQTRPIIFDKHKGLYWVGRKKPFEIFHNSNPDTGKPISEIHALQIISKVCLGEGMFNSYELNLVLKDGDRINVVDHGNINKLQEDATALSAFLEVSLWDTCITDSLTLKKGQL